MTTHANNTTAIDTRAAAPEGGLAAALQAAGHRIAVDLAAQALRTPAEAAEAAGCRTPEQVKDWTQHHRQ